MNIEISYEQTEFQFFFPHTDVVIRKEIRLYTVVICKLIGEVGENLGLLLSTYLGVILNKITVQILTRRSSIRILDRLILVRQLPCPVRVSRPTHQSVRRGKICLPI